MVVSPETLVRSTFSSLPTITSATTTFAAVPQLPLGMGNPAILHVSLARKAARYLPIRYWPLPVEIPTTHKVIQCHRARAQAPGLVWLMEQFRAWSERISESHVYTISSGVGSRPRNSRAMSDRNQTTPGSS